MRDGLTHFEEWARGNGRGPQAAAGKAGATEREAAHDNWSFGCDPHAGTVVMGQFTVSVSSAAPAARDLFHAILAATQAVDARTGLELRDQTVQALTAAAIPCDPPGVHPVLVAPAQGARVWVSFRLGDIPEAERAELASKIVSALAARDLCLVARDSPDSQDAAAVLASGWVVLVERT